MNHSQDANIFTTSLTLAASCERLLVFERYRF